ncbi:MAG: GNAT family N-acetyltransferase, partial [Bacteroidales bacterium]|nr:GNAT family N-acetyltransferase [Bacteroidales bacterium]
MIQSGEDQYKEEVKALWKICFPEDPDAFIQFYFDKIYTNENTLLLLEGGKVVSSLQMLPYQIKFNSSIEFAGYISGAMTHPDFQKRGFMSQLLISSFEKMKENNYKYSFLIPQEDWLFGFYGQYGYKEAFPVYQAKTFDHSQSSILSNLKNETMHLCDKFQGLDVSKLYITYSRLLMEKNNVVLKTKENLMNILWDFFE